jgi:hypothetical protein
MHGQRIRAAEIAEALCIGRTSVYQMLEAAANSAKVIEIPRHDQPIVRLILNGTVMQLRPDRKPRRSRCRSRSARARTAIKYCWPSTAKRWRLGGSVLDDLIRR